MKKRDKKRLRLSLEKKFMLGFAATAAVCWAAFRYLRLIPALAVLVAMALAVWLLLKRTLVEPIQKLTLSVLESHPTKLQPRFDVIEIYAPEGEQTIEPKINWIEDAFS